MGPLPSLREWERSGYQLPSRTTGPCRLTNPALGPVAAAALAFGTCTKTQTSGRLVVTPESLALLPQGVSQSRQHLWPSVPAVDRLGYGCSL